MRSAPRHRLDPRFVRAIRASDYRLVPLAAVAGYVAFSQFSRLLNSRDVAATPLTIARLRAVAAAISFVGPIFVEAGRG